MRDPYRYGLPGDVSFHRQNRIKELFYGPAPSPQGFGCGPCQGQETNMRGLGNVQPLPAGSYAAPLGKTVMGRAGMGALVAMPISEVTGSPVMRAAYEMGRLGCASPIQMAALGDAVADRAACQATTGALVGGSGIAQSLHQGSADSASAAFFAAHPRLRGETDQQYAARLVSLGYRAPSADAGWSTGISIFSSLAQTANAMCSLIQTSGQVSTAPPGPTPAPLPSGTSSIPTGYGTQPAPTGPLAGIPTWALIGGALLAGGLVAAVVMK